jgi:nucleoside-diphosphate-sugar epimerase
MRRWKAESMVRDWCSHCGVQAVVLRVPGIYGPGRLPIERLRQAIPVVRREESPFSNRIHADDLAAACLAAGHASGVDALYNVSDGYPTTMTDYFFRVADVLGLARPPEVSLADARQRLSAGMLSFLEESRRLENGKMLQELGVKLRYSDLDRGLEASVTG